MSIKTLQTLRQKSTIHTNKALELFNELTKIVEQMKKAKTIEDHIKLGEEWLERDAEARKELKKSVNNYYQFVYRKEKIGNHDLN